MSVFYNKLGHVEEDAEQEDVKDNDKDDDHNDYSDLPADEDEDYAFPLDAIKEEVDQSIYENPAQQPKRIDNGKEMIDNTTDSNKVGFADSGSSLGPFNTQAQSYISLSIV